MVPEPNLDIGKLKDPVEFFAAYERMESKLLYYMIMLLNPQLKILTIGYHCVNSRCQKGVAKTKR